MLRLGEVLIEEGVISEEQLRLALNQQKTVKKRLGIIISDMGFATERDVLKALAKRLHLEYVDAPLFVSEIEAMKFLPESIARKYGVVPISLKQGTLTIAMNDPLDFTALEDIGMITGLELKTVISPVSEIDKAISKIYSKANASSLLEDIKDEYGNNNLGIDLNYSDDELAERVDSAPVVKLVNSIIVDAFQSNASDIHIEPEENNTRIRFRIDGDLVIHNEFAVELHQLMTTRIKIIAGMNIAEKRIPQDGSFQFRSDYLVFDIRVSSLPTPYGEKLVLRLLGADRNIDYDLSSLGLSEYTQKIIQKAIQLPHGILLVTGPTGSGKTTTLYSMLAQMSDIRKAIVTVEDPIERKFPGITQVQVNNRAGLTFASGLRSILRQDPDIIMVGEIRDAETAEIAIRAAITGHFVLSTIHTNDALSTVVRLVDMGIEPFMVASSVRCVISQRLVKRVCTHCSYEEEIDYSSQLLLKTNLKKARKGRGCEHCNQTGYHGRIAAFEIVLIDQKLQDLIAKNRPMEELYKYAEGEKMRLLRDEVLEMIEAGITSVEEGVRILYTVD